MGVTQHKLLVVDGQAVIRRALSDRLGTIPEITVVGTAPTGTVALRKLEQNNATAIIVGSEMEDMSPAELVARFRKLSVEMPLIVLLPEDGPAGASSDARRAGATNVFRRPASLSSDDTWLEAIRRGLELKSGDARRPVLSKPDVEPSPEEGNASTLRAVSPPPRRKRRRTGSVLNGRSPAILAIGSSTGGPRALSQVIPRLPADFGVPVVIVQHMPPMFTKRLADQLDEESALHVVEAQDRMDIVAGSVYIAPGGYHMELRRAGLQLKVHLHQGPAVNSCRPAVDVLFDSVAQLFGGTTVAAILTGMGADGLSGCQMISEAGGYIVTQDQATSVVWGMPGYVTRAGLADETLPIDEIANSLIRACSGAPSRARATKEAG